MDSGVIVALIAALLGGGLTTEFWRTIVNRGKIKAEGQQAEVNLFYPIWKEEITRIQKELTILQRLVSLLAEEIRRLGGNPHSIISENRQYFQGPKEEDKS